VFLFAIEGFYILRIFDFYASFMKSVIDTIKDSTPILSVFFIVNMVMACLFYLLDNIESETTNEEYCQEDATSAECNHFGNIFIASYFLSVGDFGITEDWGFKGIVNIMRWALFFFFTIIQLLVLLNMVIAVMSSSFERVSESNDEQILREKLSIMNKYRYLLEISKVRTLTNTEYIVSLNLDPPVVDDE